MVKFDPEKYRTNRVYQCQMDDKITAAQDKPKKADRPPKDIVKKARAYFGARREFHAGYTLKSSFPDLLALLPASGNHAELEGRAREAFDRVYTRYVREEEQNIRTAMRARIREEGGRRYSPQTIRQIAESNIDLALGEYYLRKGLRPARSAKVLDQAATR